MTNDNHLGKTSRVAAEPEQSSLHSGPHAAPPLAERLFKGTLWMFAMRWAMRLMGLFSVAVLARLLDKESFGIVAMANAMIALPIVLLEFGLTQAIVRERTPTAGLYNTAWTLQVGQMTVVALSIYLLAPYAADFYHDSRIGEIIPILALTVFISGLENIWTVSFQKDMQYQRDFLFNAACKFISVFITIALAFSLRSYWALVYGQLAGTVLRLGISLIVAPERPRPTLSHWRQLWSFSQWALVRGLANYVVQHADRIILGRLMPAATVGAYAVGREIAEMPISEISLPAIRALGPGLSAMQNEPDRLAQAVLKSLGAVATITFPTGLGLALVAPQAVPIMLGDGWLEAVPVLQVLGITAIVATLMAICNNTLMVIGYVRDSAMVMWIRALTMAAVAIPGAIHYGAVGAAGAFLIANLVGMGANLFFLSRRVPALGPVAVFDTLKRPALGAILMLAPLLWLETIRIEPGILLLAAKVGAGVLIYGVSVSVLWHAAGRPDGLERFLFGRLKQVAGR